MTRRLSFSTVDSSMSFRYLEKARGSHKAAVSMHEAGGFAGHAIAIVAVHAAIAYADALSIKAKRQKSKSGDHRDAADFLQDRIRIHTDADRIALGSLRALLRRKDQVSYADDLVRDAEASRILDDLARFADWAEKRFAALP